MMSTYEQQVRELIRNELKLEADVVYDNPVIQGHVSLAPLGVLGYYVVFKQAGKIIAAPVPFGLSLLAKEAA